MGCLVSNAVTQVEVTINDNVSQKGVVPYLNKFESLGIFCCWVSTANQNYVTVLESKACDMVVNALMNIMLVYMVLTTRFTKACKDRWNMKDDEISDYWSEVLNDKSVPKSVSGKKTTKHNAWLLIIGIVIPFSVPKGTVIHVHFLWSL